MLSAIKRISDARRRAEPVPFDDRSRIVIMSDCHRGNGDGRFDNFLGNRNIYYAALSHYDREKYTYFELGDGDELWENKRPSEIVRMYRDIFELLSGFYRDGRFYMLYGNHDMVKKDDVYVRRYYSEYFPGIRVYKSILLWHRYTGDTIFLIHGHQADFLNDPLWKFARFLVRYFWRKLELIGVNDPTSAARNYRRRIDVEKKLMRWAERQNQIMIAGHTHRPVFPVSGKGFYFNDGCCVHPNGITAIEIVEGSISLVRWGVKTRWDGLMFIGKDILEGPHRIAALSAGSSRFVVAGTGV
jgi:UDP-2,3-diacylglucosamine pyrophosphatase LpxH